MAVDTSPAPAPASAPAPARGHTTSALFAFNAAKDGLTVMELVGLDGDEGQTRVEVTVRSVRAPEGRDPQRLSYSFPTREQARKFADDAMITFEYVGCRIETNVSPPD